MGRLIKVTNPLLETVRYQYDKAGNLISKTDKMGNTTEYEYDKLNRLVEKIDALNHSVKYKYDAKGNRVEMVNKNGNSYQYRYNALDRLVKEINYKGKEKAYSYDGNGNLTKETDFKGETTTYDYDKLDRLLKVIFGDEVKKEFSYNANGQMTAAVNKNSKQKYYYDQLSQLTKVEFTSNGMGEDHGQWTVKYKYNQTGKKTAVILNNSKIDKARITEYEYDQLSRLKRVKLPDGEEVEYNYDKLNRVISKINSNQTGTSYNYTARGQIATINHWRGKPAFKDKILKSYGYLYNAGGQRTFQIEGNGQLTAYKYDPVGRLTKVYYPFTDRKKVEDLKERFYYGMEPEWEEPYDYSLNLAGSLDYEKEENLREQLNELKNSIPAYSTDKNNPGNNNNGRGKAGNNYGTGQTINIEPGQNGLNLTANVDVSFKKKNQLEKIYQQIGHNNYGIETQGGNYWVEEFSYDPAGNVTKKANGWGEIKYQYNEANQLMKAGNRSFAYDANGNLTRERLNNHQTNYLYNYNNRLVKIINNKLPHNYQGLPFRGKVSYGYDALGRKIEKKVNKINQPRQDVSHYIYDGQEINILAEYEVSGFKPGRGPKNNASKGIGKYQNYSEYYGNDILIAMTHSKRLLSKNNGYGKGNVKTSFYHQDALGSVAMLTGKNGQVRGRYTYDAYGNPYNGRFQQGNTMNPYGFTGKRYESEFGIYSFAYRHYNPRTMRWLTVDPVKDGTNWYVYVNADPVNFVDPLG